MDSEQLVGSDLILLLLAAPTRWEEATNRINGITRLEKLLFIASNECDLDNVEDAFEFTPYHYGPYSRAVYEAVEILEEAGLIRESRPFVASGLDRAEELFSDMTNEIEFERQFILTPDGEAIANYLAKWHRGVSAQLSEIKDRHAGVALQSLIRYVYTRYPTYAIKSRIRDEIL